MPDVQLLSRELGVPFLIGAEYVRVRTQDDYDLYNATMLVDADGVSEDWSAKVYLVAFAEARLGPFSVVWIQSHCLFEMGHGFIELLLLEIKHT